MKIPAFAAAAAVLLMSAPAVAQDEYPLMPAEYVEVTGIHIDDGHSLDYANHLATIWRRGQDFAMQQGWITGYEILSNAYPREGEPDLYLLTRFTEWESPEEGERRGRMYRQHMQSTIAEMQAQSGARADYRTVGSSSLLRRLTWRN